MKKEMELVYYLGKNGNSHGPYSEGDLEALRSSGEIQQYTYLWNPAQQIWIPIEPPPPPPVPLTGAVAKKFQIKKPLDILCHDWRALVAGETREVDSVGCWVTSRTPSLSPQLRPSARVVIHLHDPDTEQSTRISATLIGIERADKDRWAYRFQWITPPGEFFRALR